MNRTYEVARLDGEINATVFAVREGRVLFDAYDLNLRLWRRNLCRPIGPFVRDYGIEGWPSHFAVEASA